MCNGSSNPTDYFSPLSSWSVAHWEILLDGGPCSYSVWQVLLSLLLAVVFRRPLGAYWSGARFREPLLHSWCRAVSQSSADPSTNNLASTRLVPGSYSLPSQPFVVWL